jgi:hypothetical protein
MTALLPAVCPGLAVGFLVACIALAAHKYSSPRPGPPACNRDVLAPPGPLYGARRLPVRSVPPVVVPPDARHYQQVAGIWGPDILEIPHTVREYPYVDWQARIQERRN